MDGEYFSSWKWSDPSDSGEALVYALDTKSPRQVLKFVEKINGQFGTTVVIITHNEAIAGMADRIVRLKDGQICENRGNERKIPAAELVL